MLIEVIVSTLMIAVVVVATLTGFDVFNRATADERRHAEATLLAAQSQEYLRSDPGSALLSLETVAHVYTRAVGGTTYTVTQEAKPVGASGSTTGCSITEATSQSGANFQITSIVTWPQLAKGRPPVKQSSIITPPTGSNLEIDVGAEPAPATIGVPGVAVTAKFTPVESSTQTSVEGTTNSGGCLVFTGLPATEATVEVAEKPRFVTPTGALKWPTEEVTIAPNITTHHKVTYNEGGKIAAEFTYKGETTWEGKPVTSDTFVAFQGNMLGTEFAVGSTKFEYESGGEEHYKALTGTFAASAETAAGVKYSAGDLFPFPKYVYVVYAGDCSKNKVEGQTAEATVKPGATTATKVPLSYVTLNVKSGTKAKPGSLETTTYPVAVTNSECPQVPVHASSANTRHNQESTKEGHLSNPFQPFGKQELCLYNAAAQKTYTATYTNSTVAGNTVTLYLGEISKAEREAEETKTRVKREETEATKRKAREESETAKLTARKATEKTERETWKTEESKGKITNSERKAKEKAQEKSAETAKKTEESEKTAAESKEASEKASAEKTEATARAAAETAEKEREKEFIVASGVEKC